MPLKKEDNNSHHKYLDKQFSFLETLIKGLLRATNNTMDREQVAVIK